MKPIVKAVMCGDLHLSHTPPLIRSGEDWYKVQKNYLRQLSMLAKHYSVPVLCSGDVFDCGWKPSKCPPELINFAIVNAPDMISVIGNHDLPHHKYEDIGKSAYYTLMRAGKVKHVDSVVSQLEFENLRIWGFPWGTEVHPPKYPHDLLIEIAIIHSYVWTTSTGYPGAKEEARLGSWKERLKGYDVVLFGDNHKTVTFNLDRSRKDAPAVFNPGTFIRRKVDEIDHKPCVGLLMSDGTVQIEYLDTSEDKFLEINRKDEATVRSFAFLEELMELSTSTIDFTESVMRILDTDKIDRRVKEIVLNALGGKNYKDKS